MKFTLHIKETFTKVCRLAKKNYLTEKFLLHEKNSREVWKLLNKTLGRKNKTGQSFPSEFKSGGKSFVSSESIANGFNDYFADIGYNLASKIPHSNKKFSDFLGDPLSTNFEFRKLSCEDIISTSKKNEAKNQSRN